MRHARHDVALAHARHVRPAVDQAVRHVGDRDGDGLHAEGIDHQLGVIERFLAGCFIRHAHCQHVLAAERFSRQIAGKRRIDAAGKAERHLAEAGALGFAADKAGQDAARQAGVNFKAVHFPSVTYRMHCHHG